ncbi:hypothetical protein PHMEG_0001387 [Phytophthora megakarya]|uniref:Uncharacterized protein n=1 Tax=Phytophthora megakarya TaxID=4795 RepID=A0A225X204_9STRA|nr:hypothetical protein PHMEG_0001387 [Phytophthora megakarya]
MCDRSLHDWAASTTEKWAQEAKTQWRRHQKSEMMVRIRANKKEAIKQLRSERDALELQVKQQLNAFASQRATADEPLNEEERVRLAVRRLALEGDNLRQENAKLRHKLQKHARFWSMSSQAFVTIAYYSDEIPMRQTLDDARKKNPRLPHPDEGWRVHFPNGEPSFYFQPFTRSEFDAAIKHYHELAAEWEPTLSAAGQLFGWAVSLAPVSRRPGNSFVTCARFTTRVCCALDAADRVLVTSDINKWRLVVTPPGYRADQRASVNTQVLQEFDKDAQVMVFNIPGKTHTRFFHVHQRQVTVNEASGQRAVVFTAMAADSKANARCRDAEELQHNVRWIREGGHTVKFTEVNHNTIEIVCEHWAVCESELQARHLYIRWAHAIAASYWSDQLMLPKLLKTK